MKKLVRRLVPDAIGFHEAAMPSVPRSVAELCGATRKFGRNLAVLIVARDAGVKRFMFASSSPFMVTPTRRPSTKPDANPLSPSPAKIRGGKIRQLFHQLMLATVGLRYFNCSAPAGVRFPLLGVIAKFLHRNARGRRR